MFLLFQVVNVLYTENDWVYVVSEDAKEGFIPNSYCAAYGTQQATLILNMKKKMPRDNSSLLLPGIPGSLPGHGVLRPGEPDINTTAALSINNGKGRNVQQLFLLVGGKIRKYFL